MNQYWDTQKSRFLRCPLEIYPILYWNSILGNGEVFRHHLRYLRFRKPRYHDGIFCSFPGSAGDRDAAFAAVEDLNAVHYIPNAIASTPGGAVELSDLFPGHADAVVGYLRGDETVLLFRTDRNRASPACHEAVLD